MPAICTVRRSRSFPNESETTDRAAELEDFLSSRSGVTDLSMDKQETEEKKGVDREENKKQREKVQPGEDEEEEEEEEEHWKDASPLTPICSPSKKQAKPLEKADESVVPSKFEEDRGSRFYSATDKILPEEDVATPIVETIGMEKDTTPVYEVPDVVTSVEPVTPKVKLKEEVEQVKTPQDEVSKSTLKEETIELPDTSSLPRKKSDQERRKSLRRYDSFESGPRASTETLDRSEGSSGKTSKKRLRAEREGEDGGVKRRSKRTVERERRSKDGETSKRRSREERKSLKEQECIERVTQYLSKHSSLAFMEPYSYSTFDEDSSLLRSLDDERRRRMEREAAERAKTTSIDVVIESGGKEEVVEDSVNSKPEKVEEKSNVVPLTVTPLVEESELTIGLRSSKDSIEARVSETPVEITDNLQRSLKPSISDTEVVKAAKRPSSLRKRKGTISCECSKESLLEEAKKEVRIRETVQEIFFEDGSDQLSAFLPEVQLVKARIITAEEAAARFEAIDAGTKIDVRSPPEIMVVRHEDVKVITSRIPLPGKITPSQLQLPALAKSTSENALVEDEPTVDDNKVSERNIKPEILLDLSKVSDIVDDSVVVSDKEKDIKDKKVLSRTGSEGSKRPFTGTKAKLVDQRANKVSVLSLPSEPEPELTILSENVAVLPKEEITKPKEREEREAKDFDIKETSFGEETGEGKKQVELCEEANVSKEEKVKDNKNKKESLERDYEETLRQQEERPLLEEKVTVGQSEEDTLISKEHSLEYQSQTLESQPEPLVPAPVSVTPRNFFKSVPESWNREVYEDSFEEVQRSFKETQYSPREKREVETQTEQETKSTQCSPDQSATSSAEIFETAGFHVALRFYQSPKREVQTQTQGESKSVQCSLDDLVYHDSSKDSRGLRASTESLGRSDRTQVQESKSVQCIPEDISSDASKSLDDDKEEFFSPRREVEVQTYQESKAIQCTDEEFPRYEPRCLERSPSRPASLIARKPESSSATSPRKFATVVFVEGRTTMTVTHRDHDGNVAWSNHWGPERLVEIYREPKTSLGLSIVGGKVDLHNGSSSKSQNICGIFIKNVLPNSPAGRTGDLKIGDRIIEVDGVDLRNSTHERAVEVIQAAGNPVCLLVQSLVHLQNTEHESNSQDGRSKNRLSGVAPGTPTASFRQKPSPVSPARSITPEVIQGGIEDGEKTPSRGDFKRQSIRSTDGAGPSARRSSMKKSVRKKAPSPPSNPGILREVSEEREDHAPPAQKPTVSKKYSSEESSEEEDIRELEGNVYTKAGMEISRKSAGNVKRSKEEIEADPEQEDEFGYTQRKVQKKYHNMGHKVLMVKVEKERGGLGISLAGHKDRNRMAVFICGINPKGSAYKVGELLVGDEILEVNGMVLQGRCHLNASALIKGMAGPYFKIIVIRKSKAVDDIAVKPLLQFPPILDEGEQYSHYKGVRVVPVKKGQYGLGIMIIEGKHAEVGQGIFVSDIQEGSAAEQAGLQVGDLILAVNMDCLLGSTYDEATSLLKKAEGVVKLTVCNPNQSKIGKDGEEIKTEVEAKPVEKKEPEKPKEPEPPQDPKDCKIQVGKDTTIEFQKEKDKGIGFTIAGGSDTPLNGVFILEVYPDGAAGKDGRLQAGDQILDMCQESFKAIEHDKAHAAVLKAAGTIVMVVHRSDKAPEEVEVELTKKSGKGAGLCLTGFKSGKGAYVSDLLPGGSALESGKICKGDRVVAICGQDVREAPVEDIAVHIKVSNPVQLKLARYKSAKQ